jgi:phosphoglycerol transferase MdoB-like AlkP superfamily enzyme
LGIVKELAKFYFLFVAVLFLGRFLLYVFYFERFGEIGFLESLLSFLYGLRMDTIAVCIILVVPTLVLGLAPKRFGKPAMLFLKYYLLAWLLIVVFIENATFPFFAQYDVRPNYLFVEYLEYPNEIASLMFKDYKVELLVAFAMMFFIGRWFLSSNLVQFSKSFQTPWHVRIFLLLPLLLLLFIGVRSSFWHRGANPSDALFSTNRILNEITKNSLHAIGYAYYSNKKNSKNLVKKYGKIERDEAYALAAQMLNIEYSDPNRPFLRKVASRFALQKPKNLVIFIQESMGAQFVGFSGGDTILTPHLNALGEKYLAFSNLYSNGTRSIRGLSAMTSGYLPIAGEGVVKRTKSQSDFFTVASLLKPYGYKSSFIYGGEGRFDNMKSWYLGNGFDEVIEQKDFADPTFESTWGVCDEDLVVKANEVFKAHAMKGEKFVSVMFSQSNHAPFELPEGKIEWVEGVPKQDVKNAIKYADFAIGRFFELAQKESYFKDTVFVVVADHNVRVYGDDVVPVEMFQIPALIVSKGLEHQVYDALATQPDVLATALDLMGLDAEYPVLGHSIYSDTKTDVNLMLFNDTYALRKGEKVAVLIPNTQPQTYLYQEKKLVPTEHDLVLERAALALIYVLDDMYEKKLYR